MPIQLSRPLIFLLALLVIFVTLYDLGHRRLANPDEGRYSEISREMAATGDFVTPRLNGLKYFEKPPLQYWATAVVFTAFGENEFTARLYTALCGIGCILLIAYTGKRVFDEETGLLAGAVMLSTPFFMAMTGIVTLDMGLNFWMTLAVCAFLISQHVATDPSRRKWLWLAWAAMAAAVLSKGLIGIVFPAAALFLYCVVQRDFRMLLKVEWLRGLLIFFAIATPWFVLVSLRNPEFPQFFFVHEHFERFLTTVHRREEPWWFFFPLLFGGFLPLAAVLLPACVAGWRRPARGGVEGHTGRTFSPNKFVLLYSLFILLFFSKSGSKLPHYILPMFPVLALVLASYLRDADPRRLAWMVLPVFPLSLGGAYAASVGLAARGDQFSRPLYQEASVWAAAAIAAMGVGAIASFVLLRKQRKWLGILALVLGTTATIQLLDRGYEKISPLQSAYALAESVRPHLTPETRLYSVGNYEQSLPFYIKRTLTLVDYIDEFKMGQMREPQKWIPKTSDFAAAWNTSGPAIAIIPHGDVDKMRALGLSFDVIHKDSRRAAIKKN